MKHLERYQEISRLGALAITKLAQQNFFGAVLALPTLIEVAEQSTIYCEDLSARCFFEPENGELCEPHP